MISTFKNKETKSIFDGKVSTRYPTDIQHIARRKLRMIAAAKNVNDLRIPPGNHLEELHGNLEGYYSIRINIQWRIIFKFERGDAYEVEIIDYHR